MFMNLGDIYNLVCSIIIICIGIYGLFFKKTLVEWNKKLGEHFKRKTGLDIFLRIAENMNEPNMQPVILISSLFLIYVGVRIILGFF